MSTRNSNDIIWWVYAGLADEANDNQMAQDLAAFTSTFFLAPSRSRKFRNNIYVYGWIRNMGRLQLHTWAFY